MSKVANLLNDLKKIEESTQKRVLKKTLTELRKKAKEILKLKLETQIWLDQFDLEPQDKKSLIDWINNLPDVKISEDEKVEIEKDIKKKYKSQKAEIERKVEEADEKNETKIITIPSSINPYPYDYKEITRTNKGIRDWTVRPENSPTYYGSSLTGNGDTAMTLNNFSEVSISNIPLVLSNGWDVSKLVIEEAHAFGESINNENALNLFKSVRGL